MALLKRTDGRIQNYAIKKKNLKKLYEKVGKKKGRIIYERRPERNLYSIMYDFRRKSEDSPRGLNVQVYSTGRTPADVETLKAKADALERKWMYKLHYRGKTKSGRKYHVPGQQTLGIEKNTIISKADDTARGIIRYVVSFIGPRGEEEYKVFEEGEL